MLPGSPLEVLVVLAAAPAAVALVLWAVTDRQRFVYFAVLGTMILPNTLLEPGGTEVALADLLLLLALVGWLIANSVGGENDPWFRGNRLLLPATLFVMVNLASLAWSDRPRDTVVFTIQLVEIVLVVPLVFASLPRSVDLLRRALLAFVGLTAIMAAATVVIYLREAAGGSPEDVYFAGLNKNVIGSFVAAGLVLAYAFALAEPRGALRNVMRMAVLLELAGLFCSVSRGSIIGGLVALIVVSLGLRRSRVLTVGLVAAAAVVFLAAIGPESNRVRDSEGSYDSSVVREYSFANAVDKIRDRPILGSGGGTYRDYIAELDIQLPDPNNLFLLTWAELGVLGMAALLFLLFRFGELFVRVSRLPHAAAVPAVAAGGVTVSLLVHFQVDVSWTRGTTTLGFAMMGVMLAAQRIAARGTDADPRAPADLPTDIRAEKRVGVRTGPRAQSGSVI